VVILVTNKEQITLFVTTYHITILIMMMMIIIFKFHAILLIK